ncbi:hypothetical protein BS17DRAFT_745575 [Gyrodon lividus]|nr:hypothetical protein BS17DRAFT_745575 [Gyrodon lividus]
MYIARLDIPISFSQALEALFVFTIIDGFRYAVTKIKYTAANAEAKGGCIRPESLPTSFLGRIVTQIHTLATFIPPAVYGTAVVLNGFQQPDWIAKFAFSDGIAGLEWKHTLRLSAWLVTLGVRDVSNRAFAHLGEQWHVAGRREKPRVVQTGPYAFVRHPLYSASLVQTTLWSIIFWSYIPLFALGIIVGAFTIKLPIEENAIQQDAGIGEEYRAYMKKVPARVIPYIW